MSNLNTPVNYRPRFCVTSSAMLVMLSVFVIVISGFGKAYGQCNYKVTNVSGTAVVNCVNVTVTSSGTVDVNSVYCTSTSPYFIGYSYGNGSSGTGSYTYSFNPPVSAVTLNVSGISNTPPGGVEEVKLYVNGQHYAIPAAGVSNGCDPMATLTAAGDLGGCAGCGVSGWNGTTINGPITTLTVLDTLIEGAAAGSIFSLYICGSNNSSVVNLGNDTTVCNGNSILLDATIPGGLLYQWSTGATSPTITVSSTGTYSVTAANSSCAGSDTIHVDFATAPVVDLGNDTSVCSPNQVTLTATSAGATYHWQDNTSSDTYAVTGTGTYSVTVSANGCSGADSVHVSINNLPVDTITSGAAGICAGASVSICSQAAFSSYQWNSGQNTSCINTTVTGSYLVTVTDINNCTAVSNTITIGAASAASATITTNRNPICAYDSSTLCTSANFTAYHWNNGAITQCMNTSQPGTYQLSVTDSAGCTAVSNAIVVVVNSAPVPDIKADTNTICSNDTATVCISPAFAHYTWNVSDTLQCIKTSSAGNYYVTVTDNNNCTAESNHLAINVHPAPSVSISVIGDTMSVNNAFSCQWYLNGNAIQGATSAVYIAPSSGNYSVVVADANGCTASSNPIIISGIESIAMDYVHIYPNPSIGGWQLSVNNNLIGATLELFDDEGRLVYKSQIRDTNTSIAFDAARGVYLMRINLQAITLLRKLIKL